MSTNVSKQFQEGIELHKLGFLEEAAYKYSSLLEKTNKKYRVYANFNLASIRFQQYRYDEAIHHYLEGLKFTPKNFGAHVDIAKAYEMTGQWDDAIHHINQSLEISPNHTTALRRKRRILEEKQFYESLQNRLEFKIRNRKLAFNNNLTVQADYEIDESVCDQVESLMKCVYLELNSEFDFQPEDPVEIILFHDTTYPPNSISFPRWAAGMYDNGSIKILLQKNDQIHLGFIYVLLRHEYVHQIIEKLSNSKCPRWLNEGLSEYKARRMFNFECELLQEVIANEQWIPLDELEHKFMTQKDKIRLSYIQARSIVEVIVEKMGMIAVRELLSTIENDQIKDDKEIFQFLGITSKKIQSQARITWW